MPFLSFADPSGLWFLPLAGLPLLIHLLRRRRAQVIPFPDIRYLKQARTAAIRISRIRQLLLLVLRTMLMLCLALIPARPRTSLKLPSWLGGGSSRVVVILDDSASMAAGDGTEPLFDQAKHKVLTALKRLGPKSLVAVVSASRNTRILSGFTEPDRAAAAIREARQTALSTDLPAAVNTAAGMLESSDAGQGTILVASDLQKAAFPAGSIPPGAGIKQYLSVLPVRPSRELRNLVWERVEAKPLINKLLVEGWVSDGLRPAIELISKRGTVYRANPEPEPEGKFRVVFGLPAGDSVMLRSAGDDLPLDDGYFIATTRRLKKRVMLVHEPGSPEGRLMLRALRSLAPAGYETDIYQAGKATENAVYDLMVVCVPSIEGDLQNHIGQNTRKYRAFLIMPPLEADAGSYNQKLLAGLGGVRLLALSDSSEGYRLVKTPAGEDFLPDLQQPALDQVRIFRHWRASGSEAPAIGFRDGDPALVISTAATRPWALLLTGWLPPASDLALRPAFPVMLLQTMEALSGDRPLQGYAGGMMPDRILGTTGKAGDAGLPEQPGWYSPGGRPLAVNIDPAESDLRPARSEELEKFFGIKTGESGPAFPPAGGPHPLEQLLLLLSALLLASEMALRRA